MYDKDYPAYLSNVLEGHSFIARLGHKGEILRRYPSNVEATMRHGIEGFLGPYHNGTGTGESREVRSTLIEIGSEIVEEIQEAVYPYLQASPSAIIGVNSSWHRATVEGLVPLTVTFTLGAVLGGDFQPSLLNEMTVAPNRQAKSQGSPRDRSWLLVSQRATRELAFPSAPSDPADSGPSLLAYLDSLLPPNIRRGRAVREARVALELRGLLLVGASTGVVLDGKSLLTAMCHITLEDGAHFHVQSEGRDTLSGTVKTHS